MRKEPIAIVGVGAIFPGSQDGAAYWNNSLDAKCFIREIPDDFWSLSEFYDTNSTDADKSYSKMAGVLGPVEFNPMEFGIPPKTMQSISVEQIYGLVLARQALIDAGLYGKDAREFDRTRTGVIMSASVGKNVYQLTARTNAPLFGNFMRNCNVPDDIVNEVIQNYKNGIIPWDEASNPGYLSNVVSGRIANRFDFRGTTCSVDSACASSLAAVKFACQELQMGDCDIMVAGGITLDLSNVTFVSFCKTPALSKTDKILPFDARADGMLLGDGAGAVILKRLSTAKADGDRIYALIEGIGSSSDGHEKSIFSPGKSGQIMVVKRAMENAGIVPEQIGMIEAHGTGTQVGDTCEAQSMTEAFQPSSHGERNIVIGGCKGQTGHMRLAAGIASLIRAALAVYHKQFLPSVGCEILNPELSKSPFFICKKPMPWIVNSNRADRYATISAFGFGGTNYNVVIKEYQSEHKEPYRYTKMPYALLLAAKDKNALIGELEKFVNNVKARKEEMYMPEYTYRSLEKSWNRIGFVVRTAEECISKAELALKMLQKSEKRFWNMKGILYADEDWSSKTGVTALFSGQGSQYREMLSDVTGAYPEIRESMTLADNELIKNGKKPISEIVYAKAWFEDEKEQAEQLLVHTQYTQPALAAVEAGIYKVMRNRGFLPELLIGHSFGELVALYASGAYDEATLMKLAVARGISMAEGTSGLKKTGMTAIRHNFEYVKKLLECFDGVYVANKNSSEQIIISGEISILEKIEKKAEADGVGVKRLNVSSAFHSPFMENAKERFGKVLKENSYSKMGCPVISNYTSRKYRRAEDIVGNLTKQLVNPVLFQDCIERAYESGSRIFMEIGPGKVLKGLVDANLSQKEDIIAISADSKEDSLMQMETAMASLAVLGFSIVPDRYQKKQNEELIIRKQKNTYTVPPTYYYLPETKERLIEARDKKTGKIWINKEHIKADGAQKTMDIMQKAVNHNKGMIEMDEKEIDNMNKYDSLYEIQKVNANVIGEYVKFQYEQFGQIKELINSEQMKSDVNKKLLFEYINNFQDNCLHALEAYFGGQEPILEYEKNEDTYDEKNSSTTENITKKAMPAVKTENKLVEAEKRVVIKQEEPVSKNVIEVSEEEIRELVITTLADITGYPEDMLEVDMTLEGDLGIDSIKRLELFSNINDELGNIFGQEDMVTLAVVQSIQECIEIIKAIKEDPDHVAWTEEDLEMAKIQSLEE